MVPWRLVHDAMLNSALHVIKRTASKLFAQFCLWQTNYQRRYIIGQHRYCDEFVMVYVCMYVPYVCVCMWLHASNGGLFLNPRWRAFTITNQLRLPVTNDDITITNPHQWRSTAVPICTSRECTRLLVPLLHWGICYVQDIGSCLLLVLG